MQPLRTLGGFSIRAAAGACAAALGVAMFCTGPALAQTVNLRMHTFVPPVSGSFKSLTWWVEKVEKDSGGKLKITLYGSMQLGGNAIASAKQAGADAIVTPCPLCHLNLDAYQPDIEARVGRKLNLPILHVPQLVAMALGVPTKALRLETHIVRPSALLAS